MQCSDIKGDEVKRYLIFDNVFEYLDKGRKWKVYFFSFNTNNIKAVEIYTEIYMNGESN